MTSLIKKKKPVDIVFYDVKQCFDSLWTTKTLVDLFSNGVKDDHPNLIYEADKYAKIAVKTPIGITERRSINNKIKQGEIYSSILRASTIDKISQNCNISPYLYRESVSIPKLGFIDNVVDINVCGNNSKLMNTYTNDEMNRRKLKLNVDKCHKMHIGTKKEVQRVKNLLLEG